MTLLPVHVQSQTAHKSEKTFAEAERLFQSGFYPGALSAYTAFIQQYPASSSAKDALFKKALTLYHLKRPIEAKTLFSELYNSHYNGTYSAELPYWIGKIYYDEGNYESAVAFFDEALKKKLDTTIERNSLLYSGISLFELQEYARALPYLEHLIVRNDVGADFNTVYLLLLVSYNAAGEHDNAYALYDSISKQLNADRSILLPPSIMQRSMHEGALALSELGRYDEALPVLLDLITASERDIAVSALQKAYSILETSGDMAQLDALMIAAETAFAEYPEILAEFWVRMGIDAYNAGTTESRKKAEYYFDKLEGVAVNPFSELIPLYKAGLLPTAHDAFVYLSGKMPASEKYRKWYLLLLAKYAALDAQWLESLHYSRLLRDDVLGGSVTQAEVLRGENAEMLYWYVLSLYNLGYYADAVTELTPLYGKGMEARTAFVYACALMKTNRFSDAARVFESLLFPVRLSASVIPDAELALISAYLHEGTYEEAYALSVRSAHQYKTALPIYSAGLAAMTVGKWSEAEQFLSQAIPLLKNNETLMAFAQFYHAYSQYRQGKYVEAYTSFTAFVAANQYHAEAWAAAMTAAMAALQQSSTETNKTLWLERAAASAANASSLTSREAEKLQSYILQANILSDMGKYPEALRVLLPLAQNESKYQAQMLFVIGSLYAQQGDIVMASDTWKQLIAQFPTEAFAEEGLYRLGELYYNVRDWSQAIEYFSLYKRTYQTGRFIDSSLYYLGEALSHSGMTDSAILQWQDLLKKFPDSSYRFATLNGLVSLYRMKGEYQAAFSAAQLLLAEFGDQGQRAGIDKQMDELRLLVDGLEEKTAIQVNAFNRAGGNATAAGRKEGVELARLYIASPAHEAKAVTLLKEIVVYSQDTLSAAPAALLLGTYYRESGNYAEAAEWLLKSAEYYATRDGEKAAEALYGAVDAFERIGAYADARLIYETMQKNWGQSVWTLRAATLLGGMQ